MSRSFGDAAAKTSGLHGHSKVIIAEPEITSFRITSECDFIVMASDGVFDVMTSQDVVKYAANAFKYEAGASPHSLCTEAAARIVQVAMYRKSQDNLTAVVIALGARRGRSSRIAL